MNPTSDIQLLPIRIRRLHQEAFDSFATRSMLANHIEADLHESYLRQLGRRAGTFKNLEDRLVRDTGHPSGAAQAHLAECDTCQKTVPRRWVCRRCAQGQSIPQNAHIGSFVCRKHHLWIGPDTETDAQMAVTDEVVRADKRWQRLLRAGRANAVITLELDHVIADWAAEASIALTGPERFILIVKVWNRVSAPGVLEALTRPDRSFQDSYNELAAILHESASWPEIAPLVDGVWALLRPTALLRRTDLSSGGITIGDMKHAITVPPGNRPINGPLQPFEHYDRPATTTRADRWQAFLQQLTIDNPGGGYRWLPTKGRAGSLVLACPRGHRMVGTANSRHNSHRSPAMGCSICSGRVALAGFNSLADVRPSLSVTWHPTRNRDVTPGDVTPGTGREVWWQCTKGHDFESAVYDVVKSGNGCPVCRGFRVQRGSNDLATVRPEVAAQWHPTRNRPLTPHDVIPGSAKVVWWLCKCGHEWQRSILRSNGQGCKYCRNGQTRVGTNSLLDRFPTIAAQLHPTKNAGKTADKLAAGATTRCTWVCELGHDWEVPVLNRTRGSGCPYCKNRRVWPGFNDAATRLPGLLIDWDWAVNRDFDPAQRLPGNDKHWWVCAAEGHVAHETFFNRRNTGGCPYCPPAQRVAQRRDWRK